MVKIEISSKLNHAQVFDQTASKYPKQEAIVFKDRSLTWAELRALSIKLAKAFLSAGLKKGDRIGIMMTNIPEWLVTRNAIQRIGAWLVPINTRYKTSELRTIMVNGEINALVLMESALGINFVDIINTLCPVLMQCTPGNGRVEIKNFPCLKNIICLGVRDYPGMHNFSSFIEYGKDVPDSVVSAITASIRPDDVSTLLFTAGTTGKPKGVMTTHYQAIRGFTDVAERFGLSAKDVILGAAPFFTNFGMLMAITISEVTGAKIVAFESFDPGEILKGIEKHKITMFAGTPAMYYMLLNHESFDKEKIKSMRVGDIAGAPVSPELAREVMDKFGMYLFGFYGMTETTGLMALTDAGESVETLSNYVGKKFCDDIDLKIVDVKTREEVPPGNVGEIVTRGWHVTQGFYKDPERFVQSIDENGWFLTGDLGVMDHRGYLKFTGRLKDLIISGGLNIDPAEIENFIMQHPAIESAYVVGMPDKRMGELVAAFIQMKKDMNCSVGDILTYCEGKIAKYKIPRYIDFIEETRVPRTPVGKVQKFKLRKHGIKKFNISCQDV